MSIQKITLLLQQGEIINYNLISEQLNSILTEITLIIHNQSQEISSLKEELSKRPNFDDINNLKNDFSKQNSESFEKILQIDNSLNEKKHFFLNELEIIDEKVENKFNLFQKNINDNISIKNKDFSNDLFIINQQIKELNIKFLSHSTILEKNSFYLSRFQTFIDNNNDKIIENIGKKVDLLENKFKDSLNQNLTFQTNIQNNLNDFSQIQLEFKKEFNLQIHNLELNLTDNKTSLNDSPTFEMEGIIDSSAIIRAIQRDSRRIDLLNEFFIKFKDENNNNKQNISNNSNTLNDFQNLINKFLNDYNFFKKDIFDKFKINSNNVSNIFKDFISFSNIFQNSLEFSILSFNQISNLFLQSFSILNKVSNRSNPSLKQLDQIIIQIQQLNDNWNKDLLKFEEKSINYESNIFFSEEFNNEFSLKTNENFKKINNEDNSQIFNFLKEIEEIKNIFDLKLEKKADTVFIERLIEKLRLSIAKIRDTLSDLMKNLSLFIKRDEFEKVLSTFKDNQSILNSRPQTSINEQKNTLPTLKKMLISPHEAIYGNETVFSQRSINSSQRVRFLNK